jgi:alpha-beta hydrolase superfamily lysophospholipase
MSNFAGADGTSLFERVWPAAGAAIGTVVLVHGYGEHISRYEHVAQALNQAGWNVRGADLRGHGQSGGRRAACRTFGEYLADLGLLVARARQALPDKPVFLVGHSFGGLIGCMYALSRSGELAGMALSSPWLKNNVPQPAVKLLAARVLSVVMPTLSMPLGLKGTDVCRDPEIQAIYDRDPLNNKNGNTRWFTEATAAQAEVLARAGDLKLPMLVMQGGADKLSDPKRTEEVFGRIGSADKTLLMLPGQYHEIFNECAAERNQNLATLTAWLKDRHAASSGAKLRTQTS